MMFKNSLKLFFSNFDKIWKYFFYSVIVLGIVVGLLAPFFGQIKEVVVANWTEEITEKIPVAGLLYGSNISDVFLTIWNFSIGIVVSLFTDYFWIAMYVAFILLVVFPFLINIGKYTVNEMLYKYMSSKEKDSFCAIMIKTIRKSSVYAILKTLCDIVLAGITVSIIYGIVLIDIPFYKYILPTILCLGISLIVALGQMFTSGWAPARVVYDENISKSYNAGLRVVFRRYSKILATNFIINVIFTLLIMGFGLLSAILFVPLYFGLLNMFQMVMFFGGQGMRYYVDNETVLTPKKLEQLDPINKTKYLL